jgi:hypothetical protein
MAIRGVYEKVKDSGVWWILWYDSSGQRHREKVGRKLAAIELHRKRKEDSAAGRKLDRPLRQREKTFKEFAANALKFSKEHKSNPRDDEYKIKILIAEFGSRPADKITQQERSGGN